MKFYQIARLFYEWGWEIKHEHYVAFSDYMKEMVKRKRVMMIYENDEPIAVILYFLTDDYKKLIEHKRTWDIVEDNPDGHQIYIDKMICKSFSRQLVREIKLVVEKEFPNVIMGVYHRAPNNKCVKIHCGGKSELQSTVS